MNSAPHLLLLHQSLPPIQNPKPTLAAQNSTPGARQSTPTYITACAKTTRKTGGGGGRRKNPDDYHATLTALNSKGRFPRKSLGQHYMLDSEVNDQLVAAAEVGEGDVVLEIGPGTGSLTNVLINAGATVLAIEKDPYMATLVSERFAQTGQLKVVANIPFNISTDVVKQLLPMGDIFSEVVLLLQEETAFRLVKSYLRTSEYRPINIFINFYSDPEFKFKVPRANFFPQPNVDAAVVKFRLKEPTQYPSVSSTKSFFSMVNSAFNGKRKMLRKSLQHICTPSEIESALENVGRPATSRPEELTTEDFVKLHNMIVTE
uniref:probable dimethyladenosine transferase isoform X2 n=1 Tax=Fragaria vesca subsp. vesca TaxID=101020 RepID=UPI0005CA0B7A|nr:PREDICTED: probable dimethyladenosine transferase isoform X2 [Fragaria vesca subsp. vesca]